MRILHSYTQSASAKGRGRVKAEELPSELVPLVQESIDNNVNDAGEKVYQQVEFDSYDEAKKVSKTLRSYVKRNHDGHGVDVEIRSSADDSRIVQPRGDEAEGWSAPDGDATLRFRVRPTRQYSKGAEDGSEGGTATPDDTTAQSADGMGYTTPSGDADVVSSEPGESHIEFAPYSQTAAVEYPTQESDSE